MRFMNEWDIEEAKQRFARHPTLGPATRFLDAFKDEVNSHSDGWPYWSAPVRAAARLIELIEKHNPYTGPGGPVTAQDVQAAIRPIKAFMTRRGTAAGMTLPSLNLEGGRG